MYSSAVPASDQSPFCNRAGLYLVPNKRAAVAKGFTAESPLLDADFCLDEDGGQDQVA